MKINIKESRGCKILGAHKRPFDALKDLLEKIEQETNVMNVVSENGFNAVTSSGASADLSRLGRIALNIALNLLCLCKSLDGCDQLTLYVLFTAMVFNRLDAPLLKIPSCKSTTFSGSPHRPFGCTILLVSVFLLVKCSLIPGLFQVSSTPTL
jgi:hypothetical protein